MARAPAPAELFDSEEVDESPAKKRRNVQPRTLVAIVTVTSEGKVQLEKASYNAASLLTLYGSLSEEGKSPQILNISKS